MRWFIIAILILVILVGYYQKNTSSLLITSKVLITKAEIIDVKDDIGVSNVTAPALSDELNWLQPELKYIFDHFILEFEQDHHAMWQAFNTYCTPLTFCQQITSLFRRYIGYKRALVSVDKAI